MIEKLLLKCPFCKKKTVNVIYIPPTLKSKTGRASSNKKTVFFKTKEKYEVQSSCSNCGKPAKQIQQALNEGVKDPAKEKKVLERLKKQGIDFSNVETKF